MKQILQNLKTGQTELMEVPCPTIRPGCLLIKSRRSLVSLGTERTLVEYSKTSLMQRAKQQPEKLLMVLEKLKREGLLRTIGAVNDAVNKSLPLGYCNVGEVVDVGEGVIGFAAGDRVLSNGHHAEIVIVPQNLCAHIPDNVSDDMAVFGVLGAIALQGVRLAKPELGEKFVVFGLGVIGLLLVQLLRAQGCGVLAVDFDENKLNLAKQFGAETVNLSKAQDPIKIAKQFSNDWGVDGVLIAAATKSNEPMHQAAQMCRKRARIVLVGVVGLELERADFYEKELSFQVSCSYGPGRYDANYEEKGQDYPFGLVRWTEKRNFEAILGLMKDVQINVLPLISHQFNFDHAPEAYHLITSNQSPLGIILKYNAQTENAFIKTCFVDVGSIQQTKSSELSDKVTVGFIGAGAYAENILIPAFQKTPAKRISITSNGGLNAVKLAKKFRIEKASTDNNALFNDKSINTIVITTRHNNHASLACQAMQAGKQVFVEKPLAITQEDLDQIITSYKSAKEKSNGVLLMVGFNRRFAPHVIKIKELLGQKKVPKTFIMTVNAGSIPKSHWTQDPKIGGGRIIGEACHFIDLLRYLADDSISSFNVSSQGGVGDIVTITLSFADGSMGTIHYLSNGHKAFSKECLDVFCDGTILHLDDFCDLRGYGWKNFKQMKLRRQDKGQINCVNAFVNAILYGNNSPIPFDELCEVAQINLNIVEKLAGR